MRWRRWTREWSKPLRHWKLRQRLQALPIWEEAVRTEAETALAVLTMGAAESLTASASRARLKLLTPTWRTLPARTAASRPSICSASEVAWLGQCSSRRSI